MLVHAGLAVMDGGGLLAYVYVALDTSRREDDVEMRAR